MKNADEPAFSLDGEFSGLTKREYFAVQAMSALIASGCAMTIKEAAERNCQSTAFYALDLADDQLRALSEQPFEPTS